MYIGIGIHAKPRPGKEHLLLESMHRFAEAKRRFPGLVGVLSRTRMATP